MYTVHRELEARCRRAIELRGIETEVTHAASEITLCREREESSNTMGSIHRVCE